MTGRPHRVAAFLLVGAALAASGQDPPAAEDPRGPIVDVQGDTTRLRAARPPGASAALGGLAGLAPRLGAAWREDTITLLAGPRGDARLVVEVERQGALQTVDVRAEAVVAFAGRAGPEGGPTEVRGLYAEGFVRVVVTGPLGRAALEADAVWLDLARSRALARGAVARFTPARGGGGLDAAAPRGGALDPARSTLVLRAERLRATGARALVAERARVAPEGQGEPLVALGADRLEVRVADPDDLPVRWTCLLAAAPPAALLEAPPGRAAPEGITLLLADGTTLPVARVESGRDGAPQDRPRTPAARGAAGVVGGVGARELAVDVHVGPARLARLVARRPAGAAVAPPRAVRFEGGPTWAVRAAPLDEGGLLAALAAREAPGGSDALASLGRAPRWVRLEGVGLLVVPPVARAVEDPIEAPLALPLLPWLSWRTDWPLPRVRGGNSSRLGAFGVVELRHPLGTLDVGPLGRLELDAAERLEHYARRGTGGELGLEWTRRDAGGRKQGEGFARAWGLRDRADEDRVGAPVEAEGRYWLRGLLRERLGPELRLDAEVSRASDRGVLLEWFRGVEQTDKPQETYAYLRWARDDLAVRGLARWRLDPFRTQVERLPEVALDWFTTPLATDPTWGGLYLDVAARAGLLRYRPDDATLRGSYQAGRADLDATLVYEVSLGPLEARAWAGARETLWSGRRDDEDDAIDRLATTAGWNLSTTLWRRWDTPWGLVRHEVVPEVGTRHVLDVTRAPGDLLPFDDAEQLVETDQVFLRLRTRLLADQAAVRRKLVDLWVEARWFPGSRGEDARGRWSTLAGDLRLDPLPWLSARVRGELDVNRGALASFDAFFAARPVTGWQLGGSFRELPDLARAVGWSVSVDLTPAWTVALEQQYDLLQGDFLFHRGRLIRRFQQLAVEVSVSHLPLQDDTQVSGGIGLADLGADDDPFERDRLAELYARPGR